MYKREERSMSKMTNYGSKRIRTVKFLAIVVLLMVSVGTFFVSSLVFRKMGFAEVGAFRTIVTSFLFLNPFLIAMVLLGFSEWMDKNIYTLNAEDKAPIARRKLLKKRIKSLVSLWVAPICLSLIVLNTLSLIPVWILIIISIMSYPFAAGVTMHILHSEMQAFLPSEPAPRLGRRSRRRGQSLALPLGLRSCNGPSQSMSAP